uniref:Lipocalin/cytosolic fatty-acid binding domain-containing protein n=1 Tax=Podarcis muralis TaxID=64176 RepID=A0A670HPZ3_PODMU
MWEQFLGTWKPVSTEKFDDYLKELGTDFATRKMAGVAMPNVIVSRNGDVITIKRDSSLRNTEISFKGGGRSLMRPLEMTGKLRALNGMRKETATKRRRADGKLVVECEMNNLICTRKRRRAESHGDRDFPFR